MSYIRYKTLDNEIGSSYDAFRYQWMPWLPASMDPCADSEFVEYERCVEDDMQPLATTAHFKPLYEQIKALITESLIAGEWLPGASIPSEMELARRYGVSQGTVRKAIDVLAADNLLVRRQGKGTFVATHNADDIKLRFLRLASANGQKELLENTLLSCQRRPANAALAHTLEIKPQSSVIEIKRLLSFSGRPVIFDHVAISAAAFRGLNAERINAYTGSLYRMYEREYGVRMVRAAESLTAVAANGEIASALQVDAGYPLLRIERVAYTYGDKPMEWRLGLCVTDNHQYLNELE